MVHNFLRNERKTLRRKNLILQNDSKNTIDGCFYESIKTKSEIKNKRKIHFDYPWWEKKARRIWHSYWRQYVSGRLFSDEMHMAIGMFAQCAWDQSFPANISMPLMTAGFYTKVWDRHLHTTSFQNEISRLLYATNLSVEIFKRILLKCYTI